MIIEMGYLFNRNGATLPVELVEQIDDAKDYPDVVEFAEPVKIEGTLKNEDDVFVLDAKGETAVLMECSCCLAPVRKELCFEIKERFAHTGRENEETETFTGDQIDLAAQIVQHLVECGDGVLERDDLQPDVWMKLRRLVPLLQQDIRRVHQRHTNMDDILLGPIQLFRLLQYSVRMADQLFCLCVDQLPRLCQH